MNVLEKILEEIEETRDIMKSAVATNCFGKECECEDCTVCVCERAMEIIRSHMDDIPDTNVGGDNDTEEKIRVHIAECLHRIDNIRSFAGSKEHVNNDEKCIRNIEILKTSIAALEEYLRLKKKNGNDGWIPVSERLPEVPEGTEDVYCPEFNVTIKGASKATTLKYAPDGTWFDDSGEVYNVIAWQLLPEVYKGGE